FNGSENPTYSFNDDLSWTKGKHVFKTGFLYERAPYVGLGQQSGAGTITFGTGNTNLPAQSNRDVGGGLGFASFLLGEANGATIHTPRRVGMLWRYYALYVQDDWRITPRLSLNLGVRYEFNLPTLNDNDQCADFNPTKPNPAAGGRLGALDFCGIGPGRVGQHSITQGWYGGIGPRLGLAWNVANRTIVRASGAVSYAPVKSVGGSAHFQGFAQILSFPDQTGGITPVFKLDQGVPAWPKPPFIDPTFANNGDADWWQGQEANRLPEMLSWTFTIQREMPGRMLVEAGYSAIVGTHLIANELNYNQLDIRTLRASLNIFTAAGRNLLNTTFDNKNQLLQQAGFAKPYQDFPDTFTLARALRPYPQYNNVATGSGGDHSGHSSYHSLILKVTRRYSSHLLVDASYVFSKMFTDSDSVWGSGVALDQYNRRLDKALSAYDRTHDAKINYVYDLPIGPGKRFLNHGIVSQVIGGWRIGAVQRYASGTPIVFTGAFGFPIVGNRPYITTYDGWRAPVAGQKFDPYVDRYFQSPTTASWSADTPTITNQGWFPLQPRNQVGNMTKNNPKMRNFPLRNEDVSLAKTFTISQERRRTFDLRFEGFNVLNRTQFGTPNTNMSDAANFGLVRSQANSARRLQLAAKLNW
ncbi:MAG: TonB-dependent receptor, partial [Acidobacteriota bacterium]|nr:TonB-dependent receptor [Acidobacteriota bacterium]